jgi:RNA polymerase sigma factor (TIGR02999 family)
VTYWKTRPGGNEIERSDPARPVTIKKKSPPDIELVNMLPMTDVTQILNAIQQGDPSASDQLLPLVYEELRVLARQRLANEKPGQTLQATALVHEAYLRLVGKENEPSWDNRGHFFAAAAEAMRRILVDNARKKLSTKHGNGHNRVDLTIEVAVASPELENIISVDEALTQLAAEDEISASLVKLRFFAGLSIPEAASVLGISRTTAYEQWKFARAWLQCALGNEKI